jgi:hypothetical protein
MFMMCPTFLFDFVGAIHRLYGTSPAFAHKIASNQPRVIRE